MADLLDDTPKRIFSWKQLLGVMLVCGLTLFVLIPDDPTLLEDLIRDGKAAEAHRVLSKVRADEREAQPLRYALAEQQIARLQLGGSPAAGEREPYVVESYRRWRDHQFDEPLLNIWIGELARTTAVETIWAELTSDWENVPETVRARFTAALVEIGLANERPDLAAALYARTFGDSPTSADQAVKLAGLFRLAGNSTFALRALEQVDSLEVAELQITVLRELNDNEEALSVLLDQIADRKSISSQRVRQLIEIARAAGQADRVVSQVETYLDSNPEDLQTWRGLVALLRESGRAAEAANAQGKVVDLGERELSDLSEWARLLEGAGQPSQAFNIWLEAGLHGDSLALNRLLALNPGLYRDRELADTLAAVVPLEGQEKFTLELAQLFTRLGRYDEAVETYQLYFEDSSFDAESMSELAVLAVELYRYEDASEWLQRIESSSEILPDYRRKLANAWASIGDYERALEEYRILAESTNVREDFDVYARLAGELGEYDDFVTGMERAVDSRDADASVYLNLAYGYQVLGESLRATEALRQGVERFPESPELLIRLAYAYADEKQFLLAQELLSTSTEVGMEIEATRLYLFLMRLNDDAAAQREFITREISAEVISDPESKKLIARIYSLNGEVIKAEGMLRELHGASPENWEILSELIYVLQLRGKSKEARKMLKPLLTDENPEGWQLAADIASQLGDYRSAETYQTKYLSLLDPALAVDWGSLGDIRLSRGDISGSKRAYTRALRELQLTLLAEADRKQ